MENICPLCGKKMIKIRKEIVLTSNPPQYPLQWWCGCGYRKNAGIETEKTLNFYERELWEEENK